MTSILYYYRKNDEFVCLNTLISESTGSNLEIVFVLDSLLIEKAFIIITTYGSAVLMENIPKTGNNADQRDFLYRHISIVEDPNIDMYMHGQFYIPRILKISTKFVKYRN